jgi:hypothetical protein
LEALIISELLELTHQSLNAHRRRLQREGLRRMFCVGL